MAVAVKVGPWGLQNGQPQDIPRASKPKSMVSITICSSESEDGRIFGFSFECKDQNRMPIPVKPWGKIDPEYDINKIKMDPDESLVNVFGTTDGGGVTSLKLVTTNQHNVGGPYGYPSGTAFSVPLPNDREDNGAVVAFFGHTGESLVALGIYVGLASNEP